MQSLLLREKCSTVYDKNHQMLLKNADGLDPQDFESISLGNLFGSRTPLKNTAVEYLPLSKYVSAVM